MQIIFRGFDSFWMRDETCSLYSRFFPGFSFPENENDSDLLIELELFFFDDILQNLLVAAENHCEELELSIDRGFLCRLFFHDWKDCHFRK